MNQNKTDSITLPMHEQNCNSDVYPQIEQKWELLLFKEMWEEKKKYFFLISENTVMDRAEQVQLIKTYPH